MATVATPMTFSALERFQGMVLGMALGEQWGGQLATSADKAVITDLPMTAEFLQLALATTRGPSPSVELSGTPLAWLPIAGVLLGAIEHAGPPSTIAVDLAALENWPEAMPERALLLTVGRAIALQVRDRLDPRGGDRGNSPWQTVLALDAETGHPLSCTQTLLGLLEQRATLAEIHRELNDRYVQHTALDLAMALAGWLSCPDSFGVCVQRVAQITSSPLTIVLTAALAGLSATPIRIPLTLQSTLLTPVGERLTPRAQFLQLADQWWQRWSGVAAWQDAGSSPLGERAVITLPWLRPKGV
jgi:hypothetical protein